MGRVRKRRIFSVPNRQSGGFIGVMRVRPIYYVSGFLLVAVGGYLVVRSAAPVTRQESTASTEKKMARSIVPEIDAQEPNFRVAERQVFQSDAEAMGAGALVGQRTLAFKDRVALEAFLARMGPEVRILGRIDALNVLRIGFLNYANLADLLDGSEEIGMIFPANVPENETVGAQGGAVPMGNALLDWLGVSGDISQWGTGVRIAVLDTGVNSHSAFGGSVSVIGGAADVNGHGTAVASMILGNTDLLPGVAPGSTVLSVQVADGEGFSDSFKIAEGIMAAIAAGADVINISLGSNASSPILAAAVAKAQEAGVIIVAPTGNAGATVVSYPAAYDGVIAVGAVDRSGTLLAFSNTGTSVNVAAPGYGINAAWIDDGAVAVSGTSFSSPIVAGMIAAVMTNTGQKLTAQQAWDLISANMNEAGAPGWDVQFGGGLPDMSRVQNVSRGGVYDAAVASQWVDPANPTTVQVTIQNRGTETLINTSLSVTIGSAASQYNVTTLAPGAIHTFSVPFATRTTAMRFDSVVTISGSQNDNKPSNNRRVEIYTPSSGN